MAHSLIKQPNGLYSLFSSVVDDFILFNATREDIVKLYQKEAMERVANDVEIMFQRHANRPYMTWDEALAIRCAIHREDAENIKECL